MKEPHDSAMALFIFTPGWIRKGIGIIGEPGSLVTPPGWSNGRIESGEKKTKLKPFKN